jgi:hypothetical protein
MSECLQPSLNGIESFLYRTSRTSAKSPEVMLAFYRRLFPYKPFYLWLNQEQGKPSFAVALHRTWH